MRTPDPDNSKLIFNLFSEARNFRNCYQVIELHFVETSWQSIIIPLPVLCSLSSQARNSYTQAASAAKVSKIRPCRHDLARRALGPLWVWEHRLVPCVTTCFNVKSQLTFPVKLLVSSWWSCEAVNLLTKASEGWLRKNHPSIKTTKTSIVMWYQI